MKALQTGIPLALSTLGRASQPAIRHRQLPTASKPIRQVPAMAPLRALSYKAEGIPAPKIAKSQAPKIAKSQAPKIAKSQAPLGAGSMPLPPLDSILPAKQRMDGVFVGRTAAPEDPIVLSVDGVFASIKKPDGTIHHNVIQAGAACSNGLGNSSPTDPDGTLIEDSPFGRVQAAITSAVTGADPLFIHTSVAAHPWTIDLCHKLRDLAPKSVGAATVSIQMTGTDAVFAAVDAARLYGSLTGRGPLILTGKSSYHGSGDIAFGENPKANSRIGSEQAEQLLYPCYDPLFDKHSGESEGDYVARLEKQFRDIIQDAGAENISGILIEPVSGSSRVAQPPSAEYMQMLLKVCQDNDILVIADEVMCGLGRLGGSSLWASDKFNIAPDIVIIGKSLGGGAMPIAATLIGKEIADTIRSAGQHYLHSHTYSGFALGSKAASQAIEEFEAIAQSGHVDKMSTHLKATLEASLTSTNNLYIHGEGLMLGGYLLDSAQEPKRFPPDVERLAIAILKSECLKNGVDVYAVNTSNGPGFMCVPPLTITHDEVTMLGKRLANALDGTIAKLNRSVEKKQPTRKVN